MDIKTISENPFSLRYTTTEKDTNINGTVHGGILFYVCDEAIGRYVKHLGRVGAAADANIHYYHPVRLGQTITAELHERKVGKKLGIFLVEAKDEQGRLLADALFTVAFLDI